MLLDFLKGLTDISLVILAPIADQKVWSVFSHLTAEKTLLYRAILQAFVEAKASFSLHLRPGDLPHVLVPDGGWAQEDMGSLEAELSQLCDWGNLEAHEDRSDVSRVEDFYRKKFLYQFTAKGFRARTLAFNRNVINRGRLFEFLKITHIN